MSGVTKRGIYGLFGAVCLVALIAAAPALAKKKQPDLVEKKVSAPAAATAGDTFAVSDTTVNKGKKRAAKSTTSYVLSKDDSPGVGDVEMSGSRHVQKLNPHSTAAGIADVQVPSNVEPGNWLILACADADNDVKEKSEKNNCGASGATISIAKALDPAKIEIQPTSWDVGDVGALAAFRQAFTVSNTGQVATTALAASISGADPSNFNIIDPNTCSGAAVQPSHSCMLTVEFAASSYGPYSATLDVSATQGGAVHAPMTANVVPIGP